MKSKLTFFDVSHPDFLRHIFELYTIRTIHGLLDILEGIRGLSEDSRCEEGSGNNKIESFHT
jgi:hypothetical protein